MVELRVLGSSDLRRTDGADIRGPLAQPKRLALLVYLAVATPRDFQRRDTLLGIFWPELDALHARGALRNALYFLRRHLGKEVITNRGDEVGVDSKALWTDAAAFEEALSQEDLEQAQDLYRGDLLEGFHLPEAPEFEHWMASERRRLRDRAAHSFWLRSALEEGVRPLVAVRWARRAVALSGREEMYVRELIGLLARLGDRTEALREYEALVRQMRDECGLEPSPETMEVARSIRSGEKLTKSVDLRAVSRAGQDGEARVHEASVAILPFVNLGPSAHDYVAYGLSEEVIARLSGSATIKVIAPASVRGYHNPMTRSLRSVAQDLRVSTVLDGSVRAADDRIRITARLVDGRTLESLWANTYDRAFTDLFSIQADVAAEVVRALRTTLTTSERTRIGEHPTGNVEAWSHYARGNEAASRAHTGTALRRALEEYERAVEIDPSFTRAHAQISWTHSNFYWFQIDPHPSRFEQAKLAAEMALEAKPGAPEGHLALGLYLYRARDYDAALRNLERAVTALPGDSDVEMAMGYVHRRMGALDEALTHHRRGVELDPRGATPALDLAMTELMRRRFEEAAEFFERSASFAPRWGTPRAQSAHVSLGEAGSTSAATAAIREAVECGGVSSVLAGLARFESLSLYPLVLEAVVDGNLDWPNDLNTEAFEGVTDFYLFLRGALARRREQHELARAHLEAALATLSEKVRARPASSALRARLSLVYMELGLIEEAVAEGQKAVDLLPVGRDAFYGPIRLETLAEVYARLDQVEEATGCVARLVKLEHWFTPRWFASHPAYASLHDHPEFRQIIGERGGAS